MLYAAQDLNERVWLVDDLHLEQFIAAAGRADNQDALDELALDPLEADALLEAMGNENDSMWTMNSSCADFPVAYRSVDEAVVDELMMVPITPAEIGALRQENL